MKFFLFLFLTSCTPPIITRSDTVPVNKYHKSGLYFGKGTNFPLTTYYFLHIDSTDVFLQVLSDFKGEYVQELAPWDSLVLELKLDQVSDTHYKLRSSDFRLHFFPDNLTLLYTNLPFNVSGADHPRNGSVKLSKIAGVPTRLSEIRKKALFFSGRQRAIGSCGAAAFDGLDISSHFRALSFGEHPNYVRYYDLYKTFIDSLTNSCRR